MDNMFDTGLAQRKATLGDAYVDKTFEAADDFNRPFQEAMTAWCWGFGWGDDAIDAKTRSMMNLAMIGALGKMHEWELHCRGAIKNGVSRDELKAIIKTEYVAPLVGYLAHPDCTETGGMFEASAGSFKKVRWERSAGLRLDTSAPPGIDDIAAGWDEIVDFSTSEHPEDMRSALRGMYDP